MEYRTLGRTGVKVAPLCLGTDNFANPTPEAAPKVVNIQRFQKIIEALAPLCVLPDHNVRFEPYHQSFVIIVSRAPLV